MSYQTSFYRQIAIKPPGGLFRQPQRGELNKTRGGGLNRIWGINKVNVQHRKNRESSKKGHEFAYVCEKLVKKFRVGAYWRGGLLEYQRLDRDFTVFTYYIVTMTMIILDY